MKTREPAVTHQLRVLAAGEPPPQTLARITALGKANPFGGFGSARVGGSDLIYENCGRKMRSDGRWHPGYVRSLRGSL